MILWRALNLAFQMCNLILYKKPGPSCTDERAGDPGRTLCSPSAKTPNPKGRMKPEIIRFQAICMLLEKKRTIDLYKSIFINNLKIV